MTDVDSPLDRKLTALADPTRRAILDRLRRGEADVTEITSGFTLRQPTISAHLRVLEEAGLIARRRDGNRRPCVLVPEGLQALDHWLGAYRDIWEHRLARLGQVMEEDKA
jgi:DNA-binding transcriptional ArsR family regulator